MSFFEACSGGCLCFIKVTPNSQKDQIKGLKKDADGRHELCVSVNAQPEKGKANKQLIKYLSKAWDLPKSDFMIKSGETSRQKTLYLSGNSEILQRKLSTWMKEYHVASQDH